MGDVRGSMWEVIEVKKLHCSAKPKSLPLGIIRGFETPRGQG